MHKGMTSLRIPGSLTNVVNHDGMNYCSCHSVVENETKDIKEKLLGPWEKDDHNVNMATEDGRILDGLVGKDFVSLHHRFTMFII